MNMLINRLGTDALIRKHQNLSLSPRESSPLIITYLPIPNQPSIREQFENRAAMLKVAFENMALHRELGDDCIPSVRADFGTAQVANAFGVPLQVMDDTWPAAGEPIVQDINDTAALKMPSVGNAIYRKYETYMAFFKENAPVGMELAIPDVSGPFNTAHLLMGDKIFIELFDHPEAVSFLVSKVAEFIVELTPYVRFFTSCPEGWFFDYGSCWKGSARLSNCTLQLISPEMYREQIIKYDAQVLEQVGGGRVHYCGRAFDVIKDILALPGLTGLDFNADLHDLWGVADICPENVVLMPQLYPAKSEAKAAEAIRRLQAGDFPDKRNIIFAIGAETKDEAKGYVELIKKHN